MIIRLLRLFLSYIPFMILSIILAATVWLLAVMVRTQNVNISVPIELVNQPSSLIITDINTSTLLVTFQGKGADFIKFLVRPPKYQLDVSNMKNGLNRIKLVPDELVTTSPVLLKSISPEYTEITANEMVSKNISVNVPYRIEPQKGIYITDVKISDSVILFGPENEMKFLDELLTDSISITDYSAPQVTRRLHVIVPDAKIFKTQPESVTVIASIEKEEVRAYPEIAVKIIGFERNQVNIKPVTADITLRGAQSNMQAMSDSLVRVTINTEKLKPGQYDLTAEIMLPKGIFLVKCEPKTFEVKIR